MQRLRLFIAIVLNVVLLAQAGALGGLAACVEARDASASVASAAALDESAPPDAHAHHGGEGAERPDGEGQRHHRAPDDPSHCVTSPGCATVAIASADVELVPHSVSADDAYDARVTAPLSVPRTPEPPPPRA